MNEELNFNDENVKMVEEVGEILKSRTQSVKVIIIEKDNEKFLSIQKWWRKDAEKDAWKEGKGFHFNLAETKEIKEFVENSIKTLEG